MDDVQSLLDHAEEKEGEELQHLLIDHTQAGRYVNHNSSVQVVYQNHSTTNIYNESSTNMTNCVMTTNSTVHMGDVNMSTLEAQNAEFKEEQKLPTDEKVTKGDKSGRKAAQKAASRKATTKAAPVLVSANVASVSKEIDEAIRVSV